MSHYFSLPCSTKSAPCRHKHPASMKNTDQQIHPMIIDRGVIQGTTEIAEALSRTESPRTWDTSHLFPCVSQLVRLPDLRRRVGRPQRRRIAHSGCLRVL